MKKVFLAIMAMTMLVATSCKKESINAPENLNPGKGEFLVTIANGIKSNAPAAKGDMSTKTTICENNIIWSQGDVISIKGDGQSYAYKTHTTGETVIFSPVTEGEEAEGETFEAFYPSNLMNVGENEGLPKNIIYNGGNLKNLPMYAKSAENDKHTLVFHNICAAIKIKVPVACNKIVISANENIAGNITISYDNDKGKYKAVLGSTGASNTITITKSGNASFAENELVYVAIPDGKYNNFTIKLYNGYVLCGDRTIHNELELKVNNLYNLTFKLDVPLDAFCFTALEDGIIKYISDYNLKKNELFYYRIDTASSWRIFGINQEVSLSKSHKMYVRAINTINSIAPTQGNKFSSDMNVTVSGNIMYLLNPSATEQSDLTSANTSAFQSLFNGMTKLVDASGLILPNSTSTKCYYSMFENCSSLVAAPTLPAETLAVQCYSTMFSGCTKLDSVTMLGKTFGTNALMSFMSNAGSSADVSAPILTIHNDIEDLSTVPGLTNANSGIPTKWTIKNDNYTWTYNGSSWDRQPE